MLVLDSSKDSHFETGDVAADLYYLAGWLVIGEQLGNAPNVKLNRDGRNRVSFLDIEHNRLSNPEGNRRIHKNPNEKQAKIDWEHAIHDMTTILAGPISEWLFREARSEKIEKQDDVIELFVRSISKIQELSRTSRSPVLDIESALALTRNLHADAVYRKLLGEDLKKLPNFLAWTAWLLVIAAELYPPEYGSISGCRVQVERAYAAVKSNWKRIDSRALELSKLFEYSLEQKAAS